MKVITEEHHPHRIRYIRSFIIKLNYPVSPCPPSHLGTWLCEGGGHGSETAVSGKLV
jgi:hypothetical protein